MFKNETLMEEQVTNQYSNTVATKEASREENLGGLEEDRSKGSQDDEKASIMTDENNESESYNQILNIQEANSGQNIGAMIHKLYTTKNSKMGTGKLPDTCDIEVNRDITLSTTTENPISTDSHKISSPEILHGSSEGALNMAEDLTKERGLPEKKEDLQDDKTEMADVEEPKTDEDKEEDVEGDENTRVDSGSDATVMVEASRDMDIKVSPQKKSHTSILSGVGSKVKHSIAKVKKVITGKSSHPKPSSSK